MKALETADTSTPEKAAEVEAKTAAVKALAKKHKDTLDQTLAAIARGKQPECIRHRGKGRHLSALDYRAVLCLHPKTKPAKLPGA